MDVIDQNHQWVGISQSTQGFLRLLPEVSELLRRCPWISRERDIADVLHLICLGDMDAHFGFTSQIAQQRLRISSLAQGLDGSGCSRPRCGITRRELRDPVDEVPDEIRASEQIGRSAVLSLAGGMSHEVGAEAQHQQAFFRRMIRRSLSAETTCPSRCRRRRRSAGR